LVCGRLLHGGFPELPLDLRGRGLGSGEGQLVAEFLDTLVDVFNKCDPAVDNEKFQELDGAGDDRCEHKKALSLWIKGATFQQIAAAGFGIATASGAWR
jgi:hypothetical protein